MQGTILGNRYLIGELLDQGGMGAVYRATDLRTRGTVAVKLLHPMLAADAGYVARLRREAHLAASIISPRVVRVQDLDEHEGTAFLVMEYVPGPTLADVLEQRGPLPLDEALRITREVALALEAAHAQGIVHRDLKPQNIKLIDGQVKVLDFGIARDQTSESLTTAGMYMGTPEYSAPERLEGIGDIRSDIYSLGVMLFEMLGGRRPFTAPTPLALLYQHATAPAPHLPATLPAPVHALVARCLAKRPDERFATPTDLARALGQVALAVRSEPPTTGPERYREVPPLDAQATLHFPASETERTTRRVLTDSEPDPAPVGAGGPSRRIRRWPVVVVALVLVVASGGMAAVLLQGGQGADRTEAGPGRTDAGSPAGAGGTGAGASAIVVDGPPVVLTLTKPAPYTPVGYTFAAKAGSGIALAITDVTFTGPCCMGASIVSPGGLHLPNAQASFHGEGGIVRASALPEDGTYQVLIDPGEVSSGRMTLTLSSDVTGTLSADGPATSFRLTRPGQHGTATFTGTAGQRISLGVTDVAAGGNGCCLAVSVSGPDGAVIASSEYQIGTRGGALSVDGGLPASGLYTVTVNPAGTWTAALNLTLAVEREETAAIDGSPVVIPRGRPGQQVRIAFAGDAGRRVQVDFSAVSGSGDSCCAVASVRAPDGSQVAMSEQLEFGGGRIEPFLLPVTGTYSMLVVPGRLTAIGLTLRLSSAP